MALKSEETRHQKIFKSIARLVAVLPEKEMMMEISEQEQCTRYLNAALHTIFDDPSNGIFFRWTGTIGAAESQRGRPDIMISWQRGLELAGNVGFGEVKRIQEASNSYAISQDLVRLGDFAKAAIMIGEAEACLTIQAVGRTCTFYMMKMIAGHFLSMIEIGTICTPSSLENLPQYLMELDTVLNVLRIFQTYCKAGRGKTRSVLECERVVSPSRDRSRSCITKHKYI
ncbi:hypothetical protein K492DRAFT_217699 [Lichtheimia hyalospora FSU 10163]|nr:hypothetical protein K492DRAFT_217699 [Lichtheimia hyalospora FSU 10163]